MITPIKLENFLDSYLDSASYQDSSLNGLQVEGTRAVKKVVLGVSASLKLFKAAAKRDADALLVHHGLLWQGDDARLKGVLGGRVRYLTERGISLLAYHLPLDGHAKLGNNALIIRRLGLKKLRPFGVHGEKPLSAVCAWAKPRMRAAVKRELGELFGSLRVAYDYGPGKIKTVALVSGGAAYDAVEAVRQGVDLYICGETAEPTQELCREAGMNFMSVGHYDSEKFGVIALGEVLRKRFKLQTEFIDVPNKQ